MDGLRHLHKAAGEGRDQGEQRLGLGLRVRGVRKTQRVARVLQDGVLASAAGTQERSA